MHFDLPVDIHANRMWYCEFPHGTEAYDALKSVFLGEAASIADRITNINVNAMLGTLNAYAALEGKMIATIPQHFSHASRSHEHYIAVSPELIVYLQHSARPSLLAPKRITALLLVGKMDDNAAVPENARANAPNQV